MPCRRRVAAPRATPCREMQFQRNRGKGTVAKWRQSPRERAPTQHELTCVRPTQKFKKVGRRLVEFGVTRNRSITGRAAMRAAAACDHAGEAAMIAGNDCWTVIPTEAVRGRGSFAGTRQQLRSYIAMQAIHANPVGAWCTGAAAGRYPHQSTKRHGGLTVALRITSSPILIPADHLHACTFDSRLDSPLYQILLLAARSKLCRASPL
jgi:hypothetical protein